MLEVSTACRSLKSSAVLMWCATSDVIRPINMNIKPVNRGMINCTFSSSSRIHLGIHASDNSKQLSSISSVSIFQKKT